MNQSVFSAIFAHYPQLIQEMEGTFTSHKFILHLARRYQTQYIELLYHYRNSPDSVRPTPFKIVHGFLAKHINAYPNLVLHIGDAESEDIFTNDNMCAQWQKV